MKTPTTDLAATRDRIAKLKAEIRTLHAAPRDQSQAGAEIDTYVANLAAPITQRMEYAVTSGVMDGMFTLRAMPDGRIDLGPLLAAVLGPDVLAAALRRYVEGLPPSEDRAKQATRLAEATAELDRLEDLEEVELDRLESQGILAGRRPDSRPEIVLKRRA